MDKQRKPAGIAFSQFLTRHGVSMRVKLILIFLFVKIVPLVLLTILAWHQMSLLAGELQKLAVEDSTKALNDMAVENIERLSTDTAAQVANFLYERDEDILYLAGLGPSETAYRSFSEASTGRLIAKGSWALAPDGQSWQRADAPEVTLAEGEGESTNSENNDMDAFHYRTAEPFNYINAPLYDEITFVGLDGHEVVKYVSPASTKRQHPLSSQLRDVSRQENTFIKAERYFEALQALQPGEIYVSDVIGAYVGSNYIGMYTPDNVAAAASERGYGIEYDPEAQAYAGEENPNGRRFEGIVRWATPVTDDTGAITGWVTFALNHDHIMEFVDHITPMNERYTELPSAYEGNYAFIWDYQCRSICHPRHHSIVGFDPATGERQIPWLEQSIYDAWQQSGTGYWYDFVQQENWPTFDEQSREKKPAAELTRRGLVALDGRYLNNAPQCTGWMDLTRDGGSGSFYILWSGLYKLNTAAAIPYYTGQYAPGQHNGFSRRGFGFVAIGSGLEDFTQPAQATEARLAEITSSNLSSTFGKLMLYTALLVVIIVLIAVWVASSLTRRITELIAGVSRFRAGERQFRFNAPVKDEFGTLADSFDDMADSIEDSVQNALSIISRDRRVLYMNEGGLALCQKTLAEVVGGNYSETSVYPHDTEFDPIRALEEGREAEIYYDPESGRYLKGTANHLTDKDGSRVGYLIESADVTDMVLEQLEIERQKTLLDTVFSASPDLIWYMDAEGAYLAVNPRFAAIGGKPAESFIGHKAADMLPADIAASLAQNDGQAIAARRPVYSEESITFADGHEEILETVRTPVYDTGGKFVGLLVFARDITTRVEMEQTLRQTQQQLERAVSEANSANQHKGDFLARMSHEIRTPMNAIIGITQIVDKKLGAATVDMGEIGGHIAQIEASSQHLLGLLNDILDISKIEAGKIELEREVADLGKLANTVYTMIKPRCDDKGIAFEGDFEEMGQQYYFTDSLRLRQVLINLLGNAVKFTPETGTIRFSMHRLQVEEGRALLRFAVNDNGIGINPEVQEAIFQPFEQATSGTTRSYGGTGLGLAISRSIVELLGGRLMLQSAPGEGSEFWFEVWMDAAQPSDTPAEPEACKIGAARFEGMRMLLVDDVEINRVIVASLLEETGLAIDEAADGAEAVRMYEAARGGYDIILMDVQMPRMNGYEAAEAIRALEIPGAQTVPIVALTANAFKEDMDKAIASGMNSHVAKPVEEETLLAVLAKYLRRDAGD